MQIPLILSTTVSHISFDKYKNVPTLLWKSYILSFTTAIGIKITKNKFLFFIHTKWSKVCWGEVVSYVLELLLEYKTNATLIFTFTKL